MTDLGAAVAMAPPRAAEIAATHAQPVTRPVLSAARSAAVLPRQNHVNTNSEDWYYQIAISGDDWY
jgi:hypothetical protein